MSSTKKIGQYVIKQTAITCVLRPSLSGSHVALSAASATVGDRRPHKHLNAFCMHDLRSFAENEYVDTSDPEEREDMATVGLPRQVTTPSRKGRSHELYTSRKRMKVSRTHPLNTVNPQYGANSLIITPRHRHLHVCRRTLFKVPCPISVNYTRLLRRPARISHSPGLRHPKLICIPRVCMVHPQSTQ